ncbi:hypothetical protein ABEY37_01015 [Bacillus pacificus]|uniref:hypothetical protein n=1 Tax=Bacillus pacificus TaxID=2026187 RepID=UPI003D256780
MLIKFFRPEHVEMFLKGNLYFKNTGYFIDLESEHGEKGIGDKYEGSLFRHFDPNTHELHLNFGDGKKVKMNVTRAFFTERYEAARQFQLTCFTNIMEEDMENVDEGKQKIKKELIEELKKEFPGRVPVLVTDEIEFLNRVDKTLLEKSITALVGNVNYFDEYEVTPLEEVKYEEDISNAFLYKRDYFKSQREYRIVTKHPVEGDSLTVNLGDISDIVFNLESADTLERITVRKVEEGILLTIDNE